MSSIAEMMRNDLLHQIFTNERRKEQFLSDPASSDQLLAHFSRSAMTEKAATKIPKGASIEKALSAIPKDDPRRAMFMQMRQELPQVIKNAPFGADPAESISKHIESRMAAGREDTYKYIQGQSGFFGKDVAPEAGYEEWEKKNPEGNSLITSAIMAGVGELASMPIIHAAAKGGRFATALPKAAWAARGLGSILSLGVPAAATLAGTAVAGPLGGLGARVLTAALMGTLIGAGVNIVDKMVAKETGEKLGPLGNVLATLPMYLGARGIAKMGGKAVQRKLASIGNMVDTSVSRYPTVSEVAAVKKDTLSKYGKLTAEDEDLILKNPAKEADIRNARIKANMEAETAATETAKVEGYANTLKGANEFQAQHPDADRKTAILYGKRKYDPSPEMVAEDVARLKGMGIPEEVVSSWSSAQRFETILYENKSALQRQKQEALDKMLPAIVPEYKAKARPFTLLSREEQVAAKQIPIIPKGTVPRDIQQVLGRKVTTADVLRTASSDFTTSLKTRAEEISKLTGPKKDAEVRIFANSSFETLREMENQFKGAVGARRVEELGKLRSDVLKSLRPLADVEADVMESTASKEVKGMFETVKNMNYAGYVKGEAPDATIQAARREVAREIKKTFGSKVSLKELGNSSDPEVKNKLSDILKKYSTVLGIGTAVAGMVSLSSLFTSEAEAAPFVGKAIPSILAETIKLTGKSLPQAADTLVEAGFGSPVVNAAGDAVESFMQQKSFAPKNIDIFKRTTIVRILDSLGSLHTRGRYHFETTLEDGSDGMTNPGVILAYVSQIINANVEAGIGVSAYIIKRYGLENKVDEVTAAFKPLVAKYHNAINLEVPLHHGKIKMYNDVLAGKYKGGTGSEATSLSNAMRYVKKDVSKLSEEDKITYDLIMAERQKSVDALEKLKPTIKAFEEEYDIFARDVASKYSTSRVAFAVDGYGMKGEDPWLAGMLSADEREAVDKITALMTHYGARMRQGGHQTVAGPFMHHPTHPLVDYSKSIEYLNTLTGDGAESMRLVNFYHRSAGSKLMMPETGYILGKYIPDAEKRIQVSDFWRVGRPDGWDAVRDKMSRSSGYEGGAKLLDDIRTAFDPMDTGNAAKWLNRYAAFEVARLLTLSTSVSFKHGLKLMGNWAVFPASVMTRATPKGMDIAARGVMQDLAGDTFKGKDRIADLYKAYTNQSHMYAAISDMAPYDVSSNYLDQFLNAANRYGSALVNLTERTDRGITFAASMMMAEKRGMTPAQAIYSLMDSVTNVNFLTGPNNPKWLKDPYIRTMMMFQGTPFKILEQRIMLGYKGLRDINNARLELLKQLRSDVKLGEQKFKYHLIRNELDRHKDVYGTPYATQFMKQLLTIGTIIYTGNKVFDSNMWGHVIHMPGLQLSERGAQLGLNPAVGATWQTVSGANIKKDDPDEFWLSRFFSTYWGQTGFPAIAKKMARLTTDDIPAIYRENKLNYLFGVPRSKEEE